MDDWYNSDYRHGPKESYRQSRKACLLNPICDPGALYTVRTRASVYLHSHSADGTNPCRFAIMHFGIPLWAYGCNFNRQTTDNKALYFRTSDELRQLLDGLMTLVAVEVGSRMKEIAQRRYTWEQVVQEYFDLLLNV